jgi:hypothetical protein
MSGLSARKVPERPLRETVRGLHAKKREGSEFERRVFYASFGREKKYRGILHLNFWVGKKSFLLS